MPDTVRWSRRIVWTRRPSVASSTSRRKAGASGSGPSAESGPSSPPASTHQPALRSRPNSFTRTEGRPSNRSRTTAPLGRVVLGGSSRSTRPPCERWTRIRGPDRSTTRNLPRRPTPRTCAPVRSEARGLTVLSEENWSGSARPNREPRRAGSSRSASACTSGSSGTRPTVDGRTGTLTARSRRPSYGSADQALDRPPHDVGAFADAVLVRAVRQDAGPDREAALDDRARQEHAAGGVDRLEQARVRRVVASAQPERHHGELGLPGKLELGNLAQLLVQDPREIELLVERVAERRDAVERKREPHAQAAEVP